VRDLAQQAGNDGQGESDAREVQSDDCQNYAKALSFLLDGIRHREILA
jgi:hypothetical protein